MLFSFLSFYCRCNKFNKVIVKLKYKAGCWDCNEFYVGKTKRKLEDRKSEHFKALAKSHLSSAIADHVKTTGHNQEFSLATT